MIAQADKHNVIANIFDAMHANDKPFHPLASIGDDEPILCRS